MTRVRAACLLAVLASVGFTLFFIGFFTGRSSVSYETRPGTTRIYAATVTPTPVPLSGRPDQALPQ